MTVDELLDRMSSAELAEWQAYYSLEPFGEHWKQTAYVCTMIGNTAGGKKGGGRYKPEDFLPVKPTKARPLRQTGAQMLEALRNILRPGKAK